MKSIKLRHKIWSILLNSIPGTQCLASNNEKRWIWKNLPPHPLEGGGVRPQNFSKILLRGKKQLTKNFKSIGTLIQKLLIFGAFLAKMFHSALIKMDEFSMVLTFSIGKMGLKYRQRSAAARRRPVGAVPMVSFFTQKIL